jgi:glyoxylate/succinic semialdehyde reductase
LFFPEQASTAAACVAASDVTIAMLSDPEAALAVVFGPDGVLGAIDSSKSYVDMSTVDAATSTKICEVW